MRWNEYNFTGKWAMPWKCCHILVLLFKIQFDDIKMEIGDDDDNDDDDKVSLLKNLSLSPSPALSLQFIHVVL